jgi:hypothetical protein
LYSREETADVILDPEDFEQRLQTMDGVAIEHFDSWPCMAVLDIKICRELQTDG